MATRTPKFVREVGAKNVKGYVQLSYPDAVAVCLRESNRWSRHSEAMWEVHATDPETGLRVRLISRGNWRPMHNASQAWHAAAYFIFSEPRKWAGEREDAARDANHYWAEIKLQLQKLQVEAGEDLDAARPDGALEGYRDYSYGNRKFYTWHAVKSLAVLHGILGHDERQAAALRILAQLRALFGDEIRDGIGGDLPV